MKNRILVATLIVLLVFGALAVMAGCSDTLAAPVNITVRGDDLSWDRVDGAASYVVTVVGEGYSDEGTSDNGFYKLEITEPGTYTITVAAVAEDGTVGKAGSISYLFKQRLATPGKPAYNAGVLSWDAVENAVSYSLRVWDPVDDKLIENIDGIEGTSYTLDAEKYGATGAYDISVMAVAAADGVYSDSEYSEAYSLVNGTTLAVPEISSIGTRIRWKTVTGATGYDVKLTERTSKKEYGYHTSTSSTASTASVAITSFKVEEAGVYDVTIRATGDGLVYTTSAWSDVNEEYVVYKLADFGEDALKVVLEEQLDDNGLPVQKLIFTVTAEQAANVQQYSVSALPVEGDGDNGSALSRTITVDADKETVEEGDEWTKTIGDDGSITYTVDLDSIFFEEKGVALDPQEDEFATRNYGRLYSIRVQAKRDSSDGVIDGTAAVADGEYQSYLKPSADASTGVYKVTNAGELAFMHFDTDSDAIFHLYANIDFYGYMWRTIDSFAGQFSNSHFYILSDFAIDGEGKEVAFFGTLSGELNDIVIANATVAAEEGKALALLAAVNDGSIRGCFVSGDVDAGSGLAGGLVAVNNGTITGSAAYADVTGSVAGGLAAINTANATINNSSACGAVSAAYEAATADETAAAQYAGYENKVEAGGFVAENFGWITYGAYEGNVAADNTAAGQTVRAGGFAAYNEGAIQSSYAGALYSNDQQKRNTVTALSDTQAVGGIAAGGFVGVNVSNGGTVGGTQLTSGSIEGSYANALVKCATAGGFVGSNDGAISYSYSIGGVAAGSVSGSGFAGTGSGTYTSCVFYDADLGTMPETAGITRVVREGNDFNAVGAKIAEALEGHFFKAENAANPVIAGMYFADARHLDLTRGQYVDLTYWTVGSDGKVTTTEFDNETEVFGDEFGDEESTGRGVGEYVIRIPMSGSGNVIYVSMTVSR